MARPKSELTEAQKKERARVNAQKYRERQRKEGAPARDPIAAEMKRVESQIADRGKTLMTEAMGQLAEGKTVAQITASFADAAGQDAETQALVTYLATLRKSVEIRDAVNSRRFGDALGKPAARGTATKVASKKRKRA